MAKTIWLVRAKAGVGPKLTHAKPLMLIDIMETDGDEPILGWTGPKGARVPGGPAYLRYEAIRARNPVQLKDTEGNALACPLCDFVNDAGDIATEAGTAIDMSRRTVTPEMKIILFGQPETPVRYVLKHEGTEVKPIRGVLSHLGEIG